MKSPLIAWVAWLTLIALTATTLYAQVTNTWVVDRMKAAAHAFTLASDLNAGQTGYESAPVSGKKTGNMLTAAEWNRVLEIVSQGSAWGGWSGCTPSSNDIYDSWWKPVVISTPLILTHNLGTEDTLVYIEWKAGSNVAWNTAIPTGSINSLYGGYNKLFYNKNATTITIYNSDSWWDSGKEVRVIMWKKSLLGGCGTSSTGSNSPSNLTYINPDNTDFSPLECTPGMNYMINPIAFSAASASTYTDKKLAILKPGNWRAKGTNFSRNRNITSGSSHTLRFNSIIDGVTDKLYENTVDLWLYASSFSKDITVPAGKIAEINVSVRNNTIYGGTVTVWCIN